MRGTGGSGVSGAAVSVSVERLLASVGLRTVAADPPAWPAATPITSQSDKLCDAMPRNRGGGRRGVARGGAGRGGAWVDGRAGYGTGDADVPAAAGGQDRGGAAAKRPGKQVEAWPPQATGARGSSRGETREERQGSGGETLGDGCRHV